MRKMIFILDGSQPLYTLYRTTCTFCKPTVIPVYRVYTDRTTQIIVYTDRTIHIVIAIMMFNPGQCTYLGVEKLIWHISQCPIRIIQFCCVTPYINFSHFENREM